MSCFSVKLLVKDLQLQSELPSAFEKFLLKTLLAKINDDLRER